MRPSASSGSGAAAISTPTSSSRAQRSSDGITPLPSGRPRAKWPANVVAFEGLGKLLHEALAPVPCSVRQWGLTHLSSLSVCPSSRTGADHIDADKQEQPHDVDEVPVPGRRLEPEVLFRREVAAQRSQ